MLTYILAIVTGLLVIGADRYTKYLILLNPENYNGKTFIKGFIDLVYVENGGGAWGMLSGYTWILISVTAVIMLVCIALLLKYGTQDKLMFWAMTLVLSGGIGNMIDRVFRKGYVVDFLHFSFFKSFPVFNVPVYLILNDVNMNSRTYSYRQYGSGKYGYGYASSRSEYVIPWYKRLFRKSDS